MMKGILARNKRLVIFTLVALLFLGGYTLFIDNTYFGIGESTYPLISEEEAAHTVAERLKEEQNLDIDPDTLFTELYVNAPAERFLDKNNLTSAYADIEHAPPISMWKVSFFDWEADIESAYFVDLMNGDIVGFLDASYHNERFQAVETADVDIAHKWLLEHGWADDFTYTSEKTNRDGVVIHHYVSKKPIIGDTPLLLKVYTYDGWFTGFFPKLDVPETYVSSPVITRMSNILSIIASIGYLGVIFIVGLIYWAIRATDKDLTVPVPLLSGISLVIVGTLMMTNIIGFLEGLISGWFVFMAMLAVYSKRNRLGSRSVKRMAYLREKVVQGYMVGILAFLPSFAFYTIAEKVFDTWGSAQDTFLLLKDAQWILLTPFLVGLFAAISEEVMFRKFGEFVWKRVWNNQIFIALITSLIWAAGHLAYTVHPWYLRIIELTFFIGPFLYWAYKKYGLSVSIIAHYLFNCFLVCLTLMSFDTERYVYSLLFLLVPLLIFFIPARQQTGEKQPV